MPCVYPLDAWRSAKCNESGKRGIVFNPREGFTDQHLQIPCGKCIGCSTDRAKSWAVRMYHESTQHDQNSFITLTYSEAPKALDKRHLQLFFKRLRKLYPLRYFACGEYGSNTRRPHYHAVIFGQDFLAGAIQLNDNLYTHPTVEKVWGHGFVSMGAVTIQSCAYVAGYVQKKVGDPDTFNLMSRRPGIGHNWIDQHKGDLERTEVVVIDGKESPVPKSYISRHESTFEPLRNKRAAFIKSLSPDDVLQMRKQHRARETNYKGLKSLQNPGII